MKKIVTSLFVSALVSSCSLQAETVASEYSLFKRIISPSLNWGENGLMLVPKAQPIGKGNIYLGATAVDAGKIEGDKLYLTTGSLMIGTSDDVEIGLSKRTFIWETGERSDISMDTFHLKARVLNLTDYYTPQIAVGVNGASISNNKFNDNENVLLNPYVAVTVPIRMFTDKFIWSFTGVAEQVRANGETTETFFNAGTDIKLWDTLYLIAEGQGVGQKEQDPVYNFGAKLKLGWFNLGGGLFNVSQDKVKSQDLGADENKEQYWMAHVGLEIPLLKLFGGDNRKKAPEEVSKVVEEKKEPAVKSQFNSLSEMKAEENKQFKELEGAQ